MKNKEFGSDFHYVNNEEYQLVNSSFNFFDRTEQFYFSGRVALKAILSNGIEKYSWKKIYIPTYYCHEVYHFVEDLDIEFEFYECNPIHNKIPNSIHDDNKNVLLCVNYFGIQSADFSHFENIIKIEDLTHNLELMNQSKADYIFGSLRKVLPVPVGGFVKSKKKLPEILTTLFAEEVAQEKFSGMLLKKKYLEGSFTEKEIFRNLLISAERSFEDHDTYSLLPFAVKDHLLRLDISKIIESKKNNSLLIKMRLKENKKFELITTASNSEYALILKFNNKEERDELKKHLILQKIYPMVLWPHQLNTNDIEIENTLLFVHIDFRYSSDDINYIIDSINQFDCNV